jgi:hypothetical protein
MHKLFHSLPRSVWERQRERNNKEEGREIGGE